MDNVETDHKIHKRKHFRKKWLVVFLLVVVFASAGSLYVFGVLDTVVKIFEPVSIESVNKKIKTGDKESANDLAKKLVSKSDTVESRRALALTERLVKDYAAVISAYKPILGSKELDYQDYQDIAEAYSFTNNNTEAAKYYRLAADNWPSDDPASGPEKDYLYRHADFLEGKVPDA